ncbi:MAG: 16S rRNA (adenine(1518)-N(6)/adenine(1519)-N(6))-dimethyltransferase RsmA [Actinomycetota bacterium]
MSLDYLGARRLRELLDRHEIKLKRSLGQNFVVDPNTIRKVVDIAEVQAGDEILEIGAGIGSLTVGLLAAGANVTAVEIDGRLVPILAQVTQGGRIAIFHEDALRLDLASLPADKLVGNLPYNLAATIVLRALEEGDRLRTQTVMTQREVGERLAAKPGTKAYGQVSVQVAYFARARIAARVSRRAFFPVPNVDSVIVQIERRPEPEVPWRDFKLLVKTAFAQRRKTVRRCLVPIAGSLEEAAAALKEAGVPPEARAEDLDVDAFAALGLALSEQIALLRN